MPRGDGLADRERVLEQPVEVGLVVELRRRRDAKARPDLRAVAVERVQQLAQVRDLHRLDQLAEVGLEAVEGDVGAAGEVVLVVLAGARLAQCGELDLRPPAVADLEAAGDEHRGARGGAACRASASSQATASTVPLASPRVSFSQGSPLRLRSSSDPVAVALAFALLALTLLALLAALTLLARAGPVGHAARARPGGAAGRRCRRAAAAGGR